MKTTDGVNTRYELKQVYPETFLPELQSWVRIHPAGFVSAYPPRQVNSIYFDTPDLDTFNDHIAGVPIRRKLRYRWYGKNLNILQDGQLEVKNKSETAGWKLFQAIPAAINLEGSTWLAVMDKIRAYSGGLILQMLQVSRPVLLTVYQRDYYVSSNRIIRLTIDTCIRGYDQFFSATPNLKFVQKPDDLAIIEIKGDVKEAAEIADVLSHLPIRAGRYSKFVSSMWQNLV